MKYKYNEDKSLEELAAYIDSTYDAHYSKDKFQATELEKFCFKFCLNHMTAVTQTEAFLSLEETILKDFITKAAIQGAFKS